MALLLMSRAGSPLLCICRHSKRVSSPFNVGLIPESDHDEDGIAILVGGSRHHSVDSHRTAPLIHPADLM